MAENVDTGSANHPLLSELGGELRDCILILYSILHFDDFFSGVLRRIKLSQQPVNDGKEHLIPLCETLEAVFRNGLKSKTRGSRGGGGVKGEVN